MKKILSLCLLISSFSPATFAATQLTCSGKAWVHFAAVPFPLWKTLTVQITENGTQGILNIDAGGDPLHYEGALDLDGKTPMTITDPDNGDTTAIQLEMTNPQALRLSILFANSQQEKIGSVGPARLTCH